MISVVICCYNSAERIPRLLGALAKMDFLPTAWEVLFIDNASTDQTSDVIRSHAPCLLAPWKIITEEKPGLISARLRGVKESTGEIIVFCDDDNLLASDYLTEVEAIFRNYPDCGGAAGISHAIADVAIPDWFDLFKGYYACGPEISTEQWVTELTGAGLALRKTALLQFLSTGYDFSLSDRRGSSLSSGGDYEISVPILLAGWKLLRTPRLQFQHFMPPERLTTEYLYRLCQGLGEARPAVILLQQEVRRRFHQQNRTDLVPFPIRALAAISRGLVAQARVRRVKDIETKADLLLQHGVALGYFHFLKSNRWKHMRQQLQKISFKNSTP
jgi:hypothetical protein